MKQAIVTGAGSGLGAEIAAQLADAGYRVGVLDICEEKAQHTVSNISNGVPLVADICCASSVDNAFSLFGEVPDLLVNNAGIVRFGPFEEQSIEDYRQVFELNVLGVCICSRQAAIGMLARGRGHIVHITSINGIHPAPGVGVYGATKAALGSLVQTMANEWGPRGVRVNAIAPGFIDAGMSKPIYQNQKVREVRSAGVPVGRLGRAEDIAAAVLFLDSDKASYINGHQLVIDGGVINTVLAQLPRE